MKEKFSALRVAAEGASFEAYEIKENYYEIKAIMRKG